MKARAVRQKSVFESGVKFAKAEGVIPAPETCHAIKVAIDEAKECKKTGEEKTIVINFSGHGLLDLQGYEDYLTGTLPENNK